MHIHIADSLDDNVRMILPPTSGGLAPIVRTYTVSGVGAPLGITFDGTHIHIGDDTDDNFGMILPPTSGGQAPIVRTYTVSGLNNIGGMTFDGTHIHIGDYDDGNVRMILPPTSNGQAPIVRTYTVSGLNNPNGMAFDGTHIHIVNFNDGNVRMILPPSSNGQAPIVHTYTVSGLGAPTGITFDGTHIHIVDNFDDNVRMILPPTSGGLAPIVRTYTVSGVGNAQGMTFDGVNQATLTLSTTDTDIRVGEAVDINIASDIDISNFVASDITVTGGTRGALTINSATSATLRVTAGSADTMTISIAEDAVDPGNAAVSQDFTVNARVVATITFDDTTGESGGSTGVNIALSESVGTSLQLSHLTASSGTLSNLTGSGTSWEADLAFPATGSGTVDITLAEDSTTPQNDEATASIDYEEPADAVLDITLDATSVENGEIVNATFTLDIAVGGFRRNDVSLTGAPGSARGPLVDNGDNTFSMEITAPATGSGTVDVTVAEDRVTPGNNADSASFTYAPPTPTNTAPAFADASYTFDDVGITVNEVIGVVAATDADSDTLSYSLTGTDADKFDIDSDGEITVAEALDYGEAYSINVVADDGTDDTSVSVTINAETVSPRAPTFVVDSVTEDSATITITAGDDGGESVSDWEYELDGDGTWVSFGDTDLEQTISNLDADTEYSIKVRAVNSEGDGVASAAVTATTDAAAVDTPSNLTGAGVLIANSAALGQLEVRPRGLDSDGTHLYAIGVSQRRLIRITDLDTFASEYASAQLSGNINSLAFNDGSFYYADNNNALHRIDSPFDTSATSTSLGNITNSGAVRSLCSDRTDLFGYDKTNSILYRITDNGTDITATTFATVAFPTGTTGNVNALFYFGDAFYLVNSDDNNLWKLPDNLTSGSLNVVPVRVGDFTDFDVSEGSPAGAGVLGSEAYFLGDDTNALFRFLQTTPTPTNNAPVFGETSYAFSDLAIASGTVIGTVDATDADNDTLTYSITGTDASKFDIDSDGEVTAAETLEYAQDYSINVVADDGTDTTTIAVTINTETVTPRAPSIAVDSTTHNSIDITITAGNNGGASVTDWEYELDGDGTWNSFGSTDLDPTISSLESDTAYSIKVRGVNSEGNGIASAAVTATTDAAAVALSFGSETIDNQAWIVGTDDTITLPEATGGTGAKTYSLSPALPAGKVFAAGTRVLDGNPTGRFSVETFTYTATDADSNTVELMFTAVVTAPAITIPNIPNQTWIVGTAVSVTLPEASGGVGAFTYSLTPTLPAGVSRTNRAVTGNPTTVVVIATYTYTATDSEGITQTGTFTIVVSAAIQVAPTTSTEPTYNAALGYNVLPESLGALKRVNASRSVESLGNLWYDERPYNVAGARALSFDDELHLMMGYGNANEVLRYNSLASKADNFVHLVFGNRLSYIVPTFSPDGNLYNKLTTLARQLGATLSFDGNIISVVGRRAFRAKTDGVTGTGTANLSFGESNKALPPTGYLRIGDEFIGYTGISSGAFTGITRGALGSEIINHADNAAILFVNALLSESDILKITPQTDTTRHANIIRDDENLFEVRDKTNITQYRQQPYTLDLGLTRNEDAWIETIFAEYLSELKNPGSVLDLEIRPRKKSNALDLGHLIGLRYGSLTYALRIESISYRSNMVEIKGRTVKA